MLHHGRWEQKTGCGHVPQPRAALVECGRRPRLFLTTTAICHLYPLPVSALAAPALLEALLWTMTFSYVRPSYVSRPYYE